MLCKIGSTRCQPEIAKGVHGARDRRCQVGAVDEPSVLQLLESLGEQIGRNTGQLDAQVTVATRSADQLAQDQQCPPLAQYVEPARDRTVLVVVPARRHPVTLPAGRHLFQLIT